MEGLWQEARGKEYRGGGKCRTLPVRDMYSEQSSEGKARDTDVLEPTLATILSRA